MKLNITTFYALKAKCGLDYTIKVICRILDKQNAAEKNTSEENAAKKNTSEENAAEKDIVEEISAKQTLSEQYPILNRYKCVTVPIQFSCREKILNCKKVLNF